MIWAHKRQLKVQPDSYHKRDHKVVFRGESLMGAVDAAHRPHADCLQQQEGDEEENVEDNNRKRRREEDEFSESSSSFYGYPADSSIFQEQDLEGLSFEDENLEIQQNPIRRSERRSKKKRKKDFVYY